MILRPEKETAVSGDYLWDRSGPRDPDVLRLERVLGTLRQQQPPVPLRLPAGAPVRSRPMSFVIASLAAAAAVIALVGFAWHNRVDTTDGMGSDASVRQADNRLASGR